VNAGERMARERVEEVYAAADNLTPEWLASLTIPARDMDRRAEVLDDLEREAARYGRGELLEEARDRLLSAMNTRAMARVYTEGRGGSIPSHARAEDQAAVLLALLDAVAVAVSEDIIRPDDASELSTPGRLLLGLAPLPGADSADLDGSPLDEVDAPPGAPTESDWSAAAEGGRTAVDHDEPYGGGRETRQWFFAIIGVVGVVSALLMGIAGHEVLLGLLGAAAIGALAFTFATYHSWTDHP
jgi:hypothetical protein